MQNSQTSHKSSRLTHEDLLALAVFGAKTSWPANFQIYQHRAKADGFSVVLRGHVILRNRMQSGRGFVPAVIAPGETFGIEGLTSSATYVTDAYSAENTESLFLTTAKFRELVRERPGQALQLISQLLGERAEAIERLHELASQNVEQRLISALHRLSRDRSLLATDGSLKLEIQHHRLLCEMVGATRESIALALGRLVGSGTARRNGTAFFIASNALNGHISDSIPATDAIPVVTERWRPSP
jgi:CRP-like cAMP-binding protein